jgi:hypothetical protein
MTGLRRRLDWTPGQWALRATVALMPVAAVLAAAPEGPPPGLVVVVAVLSLGWAAVLESSVGVVSLVVVAGWWSIYVDDPLRPGLVGAAVALVVAHVAAVVASYGPGRMAVEPALVRLWARRGLAMAMTSPLVLVAVLGLDEASVPPGLWTTALVTTIVATGLAATGLRRPAEEGE